MELQQIKVDKDAAIVYELQLRKDEIAKLSSELQATRVALKYERDLRLSTEKKIAELEEKLYGESQHKKKRRTKAEMEAFREAQSGEYSELKSNGVPKAQKTDPIRSYSDYVKMRDKLMEQNPRNALMWTLGICLGVRVSDLVQLSWKNILNDDYTFRERVMMYEKKTSKLQNCLITEAIIEAVKDYLNGVEWNIDLSSKIFINPQTLKPLTEISCWRFLKKAAKDLELDYNVGTHTMRRSFANIVLCVDKSTVDMNSIVKIQGLLNHSNAMCTMKYLKTLDNMYDSARIAVSDFILGKTDIDELVAGTGTGTDDIMEKLQEIENKLTPRQIDP